MQCAVCSSWAQHTRDSWALLRAIRSVFAGSTYNHLSSHKKNRSGGGGGGGGGGQQPKPADEAQDKAQVEDEAPENKQDKDYKDKDKDKGKQDNKDKQGGKKPPPPPPVVTAVLKVDMHCDGCAERIRASVRHYPGTIRSPSTPCIPSNTFYLSGGGAARRKHPTPVLFHALFHPGTYMIRLCRTQVEGVAMDVDKGTMTVVGRLDAKKLRDRVAKKTKKKVDLVVANNQQNSNKKDGDDKNKKQQNLQYLKVHEYGKPDYMYDFYWLDKAYSGGRTDVKAMLQQQDNKDKDNKGGGGGGGNKGKDDNKGSGSGGGGGGGNKDDKGKKDDDKSNKGSGGAGGGDKGKGGKDNKKPPVPVVGTVVLKIGAMGLHCEGCMNRVRAKLFKIKGVEQVSMDMSKNQVMVNGTMDIKPLPAKLQKKLRRPVDVVQQSNKDKDGGKEEGSKEDSKQDGSKEKDGKQDGKEEEGGKEKDKDSKALAAEMLMWKTAFYDQHSLLNAEFMLRDENPNAFSVM